MWNNKIKKIISKFTQFIGYDLERYYPRGFIKFLCGYYKGKKDLIGAEIGVYQGENALNILKYLPIKKLYLIDPYQNYQDYSKTKDPAANQDKLDIAKIQAIQKLSEFKNKIVWINKRSDIAHKEIEEKLDFVYIDANHSYEFVKRDMENYYPLLKIDGVLCGHDIEPSMWPGILFAFSDFIKEKKLPYRIIESDWIIINNSNFKF